VVRGCVSDAGGDPCAGKDSDKCVVCNTTGCNDKGGSVKAMASLLVIIMSLLIAKNF
jgi:hypothetical protein